MASFKELALAYREALYSPLCDTDKTVYLRYLSKFPDVSTDQFFAKCSELYAIGRVDKGIGRLLGTDVRESGVLGASQRDGRLCDSCRCTVDGGCVGCLCSRGRHDCKDALVDKVLGQDESSVGQDSSQSGKGHGSTDGRGKFERSEVVGEGEVKDSLPPVIKGNDGVSSKTLANRERRKEKKELKKARQAGMKRDDWRVKSQSVGVPSELKESWIARKNAENLLSTEKAKKDLEYQLARDVNAESKTRSARLLKTAEQSKVAVEKAFLTLKQTGNVQGFAETVVSDSGVPSLSSGSISPNSSVSEREVRAMQKELEDMRAENARLKEHNRSFRLCRLADGETVGFTEENVDEELWDQVDGVCVGGHEVLGALPGDNTVYVRALGETQQPKGTGYARKENDNLFSAAKYKASIEAMREMGQEINTEFL